jgi:cytoskeletal protein RodZ
MEDEFSAKKRFSINGWEPRWGHIGMFLVIVGLLALTWVVFHRNNTTKSNNGSGLRSPTTSNSARSTTNNSTSKTPPKTQTSSGNSSSSSSSSTSTKSSSSSQTLTNVGPGNVVGIFAVSTAVGAIGYNFYIRRKLNTTDTNN